MRTGHGAQVGTACGDDGVGVIGLADGAHGHGGNACFLANAVGKRCLEHAAKHGLFFLADLA